MSEEKSSNPKKAPARAPVGTLGHDCSVALIQKRALRPPAVEKSTSRRCPLILLVENSEPVRVALKTVLEAAGYDLIVVEHASDALAIAATCDEHIDFLITQAILPGINGGLLVHLFQRTHRETQALFVSASREEVLICDDTSNLNTTVLKQPVPVEVVAETLGQMIVKRQGTAQ